MRSSKSRSRKNRNQNRPTGNIINRVFDSQGPEGKVRGTPQQIIDKYNQLHRDAVLSGDRVDAENFAQHAEHYTRMLAEAQREQEAKREEQDRQNRERQAERDRERTERDRAQGSGQQDEVPPAGGKASEGDDGAPRSRGQARSPDPSEMDQPDFEADSGLVETPEAKSDAPKRRRRSSSRTKSDQPPAEAAE